MAASAARWVMTAPNAPIDVDERKLEALHRREISRRVVLVPN